MTNVRTFPLDAVRTDGWFERIGESIGSFQALCDILGEAFFAFSMITGARITSLTVDRRVAANTVVEFVVTQPGDEEAVSPPQRLPLGEFRARLVGALLAEDTPGHPPSAPDDVEALQLHIGVRYLLLAPLYGYALQALHVDGPSSRVDLLRDGVEESYDLDELRLRLRAHVREELEQAERPARAAIDLAKVVDAEAAAREGDHAKVFALLGAWPGPLSMFLRTPEGQGLGADARAVIAKGLGLLGTACVRLGESHHGEEVLRLGVQFAHDGPGAADLFRRLGEAHLESGRPGEAIGPLRRAANLGAPPELVWPALALAFVGRDRHVAALACLEEARSAGVPEAALGEVAGVVAAKLGPALAAWKSATSGS